MRGRQESRLVDETIKAEAKDRKGLTPPALALKNLALEYATQARRLEHIHGRLGCMEGEKGRDAMTNIKRKKNIFS